MKVKRYIGDTAQDALQKVKIDLGREAIILNTRKIRRKGIMGLFMKPLVEVVATVDSEANKPTINHPKKQQKEENNFNINATQEFNNHFIKTLGAINSINDSNIKSEVTEIKDMLSKVYDSISYNQIENMLSDEVKEYMIKLDQNDVDGVIIEDIKKAIVERLSNEEQKNSELVRNEIYNILLEYMPSNLNNTSVKHYKKVIVFVGPTGVGKTTTLAKLAANITLNEKKKVGLVTSDTYRIAAVDQLKTYCEIIGVPLSIVYSPNEFSSIIQNYEDKDVILVDTAGRSHKDKYQLMELKSLLNTEIQYEIYLVLSATSKYSDCIDIVNSYSFLKDYKILFTKLDETSSYGVVLNISNYAKKPLCYFTTGQSVPDDIELADNSKIIKCILGDKLYERSS